ncbi:hypothetical protein NPIL_354891 [Nephila pilipes]|uniref:Uncharacterized protein n=1 Tax=Nephila pilipes TaxID=299642 RepID=A0A8X6PQ33_NEPPI|nr:hypothetical protein NPIL_354891 [Nephila pilipes]
MAHRYLFHDDRVIQGLKQLDLRSESGVPQVCGTEVVVMAIPVVSVFFDIVKRMSFITIKNMFHDPQIRKRRKRNRQFQGLKKK